MRQHSQQLRPVVHCRVGSSENTVVGKTEPPPVHCRVGSSEKSENRFQMAIDVHCRVGSSENGQLGLAA